MALMRLWLNRSSFIGDGLTKDVRVNLPETFDLDQLAPYLTSVREGWLTTILGPLRLVSLTAWLAKAPGAADESALWALVEPFLVYAVWAAYVLESNVSATRTGLVTLVTDQSEAISDQQRTQVSRNYNAIAERFAFRITEFLTVPAGCNQPESRATFIKIGKAVGPCKLRL